MKLVPAPLPAISSSRSRLQRARALSRYASGPIRITLRSVEVIPDLPSAKTQTFQLPLPQFSPARKQPDPEDRTVLLLL